jgi:hypothetical protein
MFDLESALLYEADFDQILRNTKFEFVFDGRKTGMDRYYGHLDPDCI